MSKIDPRNGGRPKNALGPQHDPKHLTPHPASTEPQLRGATTGGQGHAVTPGSVGATNPLEKPAPLKGVHLQTENVPNTVGARNRSGE